MYNTFIKGLVCPKIKNGVIIFINYSPLSLFKSLRDFVHLQNTNEDIF